MYRCNLGCVASSRTYLHVDKHVDLVSDTKAPAFVTPWEEASEIEPDEGERRDSDLNNSLE